MANPRVKSMNISLPSAPVLDIWALFSLIIEKEINNIAIQKQVETTGNNLCQMAGVVIWIRKVFSGIKKKKQPNIMTTTDKNGVMRLKIPSYFNSFSFNFLVEIIPNMQTGSKVMHNNKIRLLEKPSRSESSFPPGMAVNQKNGSDK